MLLSGLHVFYLKFEMTNCFLNLESFTSFWQLLFRTQEEFFFFLKEFCSCWHSLSGLKSWRRNLEGVLSAMPAYSSSSACTCVTLKSDIFLCFLAWWLRDLDVSNSADLGRYKASNVQMMSYLGTSRSSSIVTVWEQLMGILLTWKLAGDILIFQMYRIGSDITVKGGITLYISEFWIFCTTIGFCWISRISAHS